MLTPLLGCRRPSLPPSLTCCAALLPSACRYGFIVMDGNGSLFGTLCGNNREILHKVGACKGQPALLPLPCMGRCGHAAARREIPHTVGQLGGSRACAQTGATHTRAFHVLHTPQTLLSC